MSKITSSSDSPPVEAIAEICAALGQETRLSIVRLLLSAYPKALPAGEIQQALRIPASTLSHHLDKLRQVGLVKVEKDKQWIWYAVRSDTLKLLMDFFFTECCSRNSVIAPDAIGRCC